MNRTLVGTFAAVVASAALVAAQSNGSNGANGMSGSQSSASAASQSKGTSYTGCLEAGATPGSFVLTNVSDSAAGDAKSPGAAATASAAQSYKLSGAPSGFNMSSNLNHRVQITGTVAAASATPSASANAPKTDAAAAPRTEPDAGAKVGGDSAAAPAAPSLDAAMTTLTVQSAKVLSDRCTTTR